jgi:DNA ligase D-like protein (predicted ligase)
MRRAYQPMLVTLIDKPFDDPQWLFEPKYDGLRVLARMEGGKVRLISRNGKLQNLQFPDVVDALAEAVKESAVLDGEIVCLDASGRSRFRVLQQRLRLLDKAEIRRRAQSFPAYVHVFDVLYWDGYELISLPMETRKQVLSRAVRWSDRVRMTPDTPERGIAMFGQACRRHEEGIVGKRLGSRYELGVRSREWVKVKCAEGQEFVIGGWTNPQRSRVGLGAILLGYFTDDGKHFVYAGKVGTGFTRATLLDLAERLRRIAQPRSPFDEGDPPHGPGVHWARPELVAEIAFEEWTQHGLLRQPRFQGLRTDKNASDVIRERPKPPEIRAPSRRRSRTPR